jgi:hypothetical protein
MSVKTPKTDAPKTDETAPDAFDEFEAPLVESLETLIAAEDAVTLSRVAFGRIAGAAVAALTTAGASAEEARDRIMATVATVTTAVEWETVQGWIRAATVADSLPEDVRDEFSTEALVTIGRIPVEAKNGGMTREEFATHAASEGIASVRALRELVAAEKTANGTSRKPAGNATQAAAFVQAMRRLAKENPQGEDEDATSYAAFVAALAGQKCVKFRKAAIREGIAEFMTPDEDAAPKDDGSGAPDAQ